jgi:hypothetical protein
LTVLFEGHGLVVVFLLFSQAFGDKLLMQYVITNLEIKVLLA